MIPISSVQVIPHKLTWKHRQRFGPFPSLIGPLAWNYLSLDFAGLLDMDGNYWILNYIASFHDLSWHIMIYHDKRHVLSWNVTKYNHMAWNVTKYPHVSWNVTMFECYHPAARCHQMSYNLTLWHFIWFREVKLKPCPTLVAFSLLV